MRKPVGLVAVAAATLAVASTVGVGLALAHAGIQSTSPRGGATLERAPARVSVTFAEEVRSGTITVKTTGGKVVSKGKGGRDPANVRRVRVALKRGLGAGVYTVRWTVVAADGDDQRGTFRFTVR